MKTEYTELVLQWIISLSNGFKWHNGRNQLLSWIMSHICIRAGAHQHVQVQVLWDWRCAVFFLWRCLLKVPPNFVCCFSFKVQVHCLELSGSGPRQWRQRAESCDEHSEAYKMPTNQVANYSRTNNDCNTWVWLKIMNPQTPKKDDWSTKHENICPKLWCQTGTLILSYSRQLVISGDPAREDLPHFLESWFRMSIAGMQTKCKSLLRRAQGYPVHCTSSNQQGTRIQRIDKEMSKR